MFNIRSFAMSEIENKHDNTQAVSSHDRKAWEKICQEWKQSNEPQKKFCEKRNLNHNTFSYWRGIFLKENKQKKDIFKEVLIQANPPTSNNISEDEKMLNELTDQKLIIVFDNRIQVHIPKKIESEVLGHVLHLLVAERYAKTK